jgi:hypothetical protein
VHAYAHRQVIAEHVERLQELVVCVRVPSRLDQALADLVAASAARADKVAGKIRAPLSPRLRQVYEDLDRMVASPGDLAIVPRVFWLLGALAALAAVRSAYSDALIRCRVSRVRCIDLFEASLMQHLVMAEDRWAAQRQQMERHHPWVASGGNVSLVGLESKNPHFVFALRAGRHA